jgi:hypothetical protein
MSATNTSPSTGSALNWPAGVRTVVAVPGQRRIEPVDLMVEHAVGDNPDRGARPPAGAHKPQAVAGQPAEKPFGLRQLRFSVGAVTATLCVLRSARLFEIRI